MTTGQTIIDRIVEGGLCHAECAHEKEHGCIVVWSSGAAEQLEAMASQLVSEMDVEQQRLRSTVRVLTDALKSARAELSRQRIIWTDSKNDSWAVSCIDMELARIDRALSPNAEISGRGEKENKT